MRFAVIHCRNAECGQHVWVPEHKLGLRGKCPECGQVLETPGSVPADELINGPHILQDLDEAELPSASLRGQAGSA